jgi:hypothetical protein
MGQLISNALGVSEITTSTGPVLGALAIIALAFTIGPYIAFKVIGAVTRVTGGTEPSDPFLRAHHRGGSEGMDGAIKSYRRNKRRRGGY